MRPFSMSSKRIWNEFQSTNYNWNIRVLKDFSGSSYPRKEETLSFQDYLNQCVKWKNRQNWFSRVVKREDDLSEMLVRALYQYHR